MISPPLRSVLKLSICAALLAGAYACTNSFNVGSVAERTDEQTRRGALESFRLETVTAFQSTDSPSLVWSPDGETLVYAEQYAGRMYSYNLFDQSQQVVFDANMGQSGSGVQDILWNVTQPTFLSSNEVISGPGWSGALDDQNAWGGALVVDVLNKTPRPFGANGRRPQVNEERTRVLLESSDGLRMTDAQGNEIGRYPMMCAAQWAPDGDTFLALRYANYCGENMSLVRVNEDGAIEHLADGVFEPTWAPDGEAVAFTRPLGGNTWFDPGYEYGTVFYLSLDDKKARPIAENARTPVFLSEPRLLLYETLQGVGVSNIERSRVLRETRLTDLAPSPDGSHLAAVRQVGDYYYPTLEVTIFSVVTD